MISQGTATAQRPQRQNVLHGKWGAYWNNFDKNFKLSSHALTPNWSFILQITVTLKLDWNLTDVHKPIPASYTTKVPNGTLLIDIMNKAADDEKEGPFDKYKSTYYSVMGYFITSINGTENNPDKSSYWMIYDEQTGASLKCGVSSYLPSNDSTTLFRFTKLPSDSSHGNNASTSGRCKKHSNLPVSTQYTLDLFECDPGKLGSVHKS